MKTLILSEKEVKKLLTVQESMESVELAFKMKGLKRAQMPCKQYLFFRKYNGDLRTMPSYLEDSDVVAVKIVNSHSENRQKFNLPTVIATILLIDPRNGAPLAIMGGTWITDLRTGVAGAIASKYLAKKDPKIIGFVGAGAQARTQFLSHLNYYQNVDTIKVWSRSQESRKAFLEFVRSQNSNDLNLISVETVKEAVIDSDIVISTTPSTKPLIFSDWIFSGVHINCIGADAPGKQELDPKILAKSKIVLDDWEQGIHSGEINVPLTKGLIDESNVYGDICEIVARLKPGRTSSNEITVFTSTGLAVQDAATANIAYKKALKENLGKYIDYTP